MPDSCRRSLALTKIGSLVEIPASFGMIAGQDSVHVGSGGRRSRTLSAFSTSRKIMVRNIWVQVQPIVGKVTDLTSSDIDSTFFFFKGLGFFNLKKNQ